VACLRVGRALRAPVPISGMVSEACDLRALGPLERWVIRAPAFVEEFRSLGAALAAAADPGLFERMIVGERCMGIEGCRRFLLRPGGAGIAGLQNMSEELQRPPLWERVVPRAFFRADLIQYVGVMTELATVARRPYPGSLIDGARRAEEIYDELHTLERPPVVCYVLLPGLMGVFRGEQEHMARLESARVALAALRFQRKHGRLPETLDALVPDFLEAVPPDPFDGKPLRYRTRRDAFVVYAVGENAEDDGGRLEPDNLSMTHSDTGFGVRWRQADPAPAAAPPPVRRGRFRRPNARF